MFCFCKGSLIFLKLSNTLLYNQPPTRPLPCNLKTLSGFSPTTKGKIPSFSASLSSKLSLFPCHSPKKYLSFYAMSVPAPPLPPLVSAVILSIAPTSSLPPLLPIPSHRPEQLTHQLFFLHLPSCLAAQERLLLRVARKIIIKIK